MDDPPLIFWKVSLFKNVKITDFFNDFPPLTEFCNKWVQCCQELHLPLFPLCDDVEPRRHGQLGCINGCISAMSVLYNFHKNKLLLFQLTIKAI